MSPLAGKQCIISGASRGIGLAIAKLFASNGATCTVVGRNRDALNSAAESLSRPGAQDHHVFDFDVSYKNGWDGMLAHMKKQPCDILVNAAGITQNSLLFKADDDAVDSIVQTNLMGTIWGCKSVIPRMIRQNSGMPITCPFSYLTTSLNKNSPQGCIINVSSLLATHGGRGASVYAASKAGVVGLTRSLAWEVGRFGVRANVLLPGFIQTDMTRDLDKNGELSALIPLGRLGLAEEVAEAALFLAMNPYAHNCVLNIDGGLSAT
ncbi:NAD(P)-binding protein [Xylariaceae sp. FL0662B]|nr:NAD(P)-binding protein [Xylariaceae sp. FL0662B]